MTLLTVADDFAALWWCAGILVLVASSIAVLLFPHLPWQGPGTEPLRPVTVVVPVKDWTDHFEEDQQALFSQDYPDLEIIITSAQARSQALDSMEALHQRFPNVSSRVLLSDVAHAASPKLNNIWPGVEEARHDLILTKDFNIRMAPGDLENLTHHHGPGVGLVSTITITTDPQSLAAWIEASIINCYHGRILMLASALGLGAGCGKVMLFSRAALEKAGGLDSLAWAVGEDEAMQQAFAAIGLRTVLSERTSRQLLGRRRLREVWQRQLRWMLIWRLQTPGVFIGDFMASALPVSLAAAAGAHVIGITPWIAAAATLTGWFLPELLLCLAKGWPISLWSPLAFIGREVFSLLVRFQSLTTRDITWGGGLVHVNRKPAP